MGSNQGGDISSPKERVGTQAGSATTPANLSNTIFRQQGYKPKDKDKGSEENKQFDPGGKGEKPPPWNATVMVLSFFSGGNIGPWDGRCLCFVFFCLCVPVCMFIIYCSFQVIIVRRADKHERRRGSSR